MVEKENRPRRWGKARKKQGSSLPKRKETRLALVSTPCGHKGERERQRKEDSTVHEGEREILTYLMGGKKKKAERGSQKNRGPIWSQKKEEKNVLEEKKGGTKNSLICRQVVSNYKKRGAVFPWRKEGSWAGQ